jgi:hypothetical protein
MQASDWVSRVNAKIAAMKFTSNETAADEIAEVVSDEIVKELSGVPDEDMQAVAQVALKKIAEHDAEDEDDADADPDMPGLISNDYCELHRMMEVAASDEDYQQICNKIDDLYEWADRQDKDLVVEQDDRGLTLMHWALMFRCPSVVVQTLINAYPDILTYVGDDDCLPLHYAARYRCSLDVVKDVYSIYPAAILELNEAGIPPTLIARCGGASKEVVDFLDQELRITKAEAAAIRAKAAKAAKAAAEDEEEYEDEDDDDEPSVNEDVSDNRKNADTLDLMLAILCGLGVLLFAIMYANTVVA